MNSVLEGAGSCKRLGPRSKRSQSSASPVWTRSTVRNPISNRVAKELASRLTHEELRKAFTAEVKFNRSAQRFWADTVDRLEIACGLDDDGEGDVEGNHWDEYGDKYDDDYDDYERDDERDDEKNAEVEPGCCVKCGEVIWAVDSEEDPDDELCPRCQYGDDDDDDEGEDQMLSLNIKLEPAIHVDGDGCWPDLREKGWKTGLLTSVSALAAGMESGRPSVMFRIELEDGTVVLAETSMRLLSIAVRGFTSRYGDPHSDEPPARA